MATKSEQYVAALDVGTTSLRCLIVNSQAKCIAQESIPVKLLYPQQGFYEIDPDALWTDVQRVITSAIATANLQPKDISSLGITTQRATFITWRKDNGAHFHNFITWKDIRSKVLVKRWNKSLMMKTFRSASYLIYLMSRSNRFLAGSTIQYTSSHVSVRLLWVLENIPGFREAVAQKNVMFGTVDTWLLYKLTGGRTYVTEFGNASSTGLFDPFALNWSYWIHTIIGIPLTIYPEIVSNDYDFGATEAKLFGVPIKIGTVMADAHSSMFGCCCFQFDTLKVTLGTGSFLNIRTEHLYAGLGGLYPVIYYKLNNQINYMAEGACNDTGTVIQWALKLGLCEDPSQTSDLAYSVKNNDGVYFIPAFSGLGPPISDEKAASGFLGVKPTTQKGHMMRAMLESIVFRIMLQYSTIKKDVFHDINKICVDGGVSKNDFICQMISDMTGLEVERLKNSEMSGMGAAFVAGINSGIWKDKEEIESLRQVDRVFKPVEDKGVAKTAYFAEMQRWRNVVDRFKSWYS